MKDEVKIEVTSSFILFILLSKIEILNTRERLQLEVKLGIEATWRKYLQNSSKSYAEKLVLA
ncbi:hypothetical protein Cylst_3212 [Cylindrospermum stagnale PCC 7417]|uniref:Uncharacterized protein n=1 Tax=Cylindrospermum stagnale PCC 7417 TaxID=56107 RepID=K9WYD0_9NOST|nr:hypothetical protein Cylst_3212 [Cylindrospermum stagnale PCC 7417]